MDEEIRSALRTLAEPRPAPPDARSRIMDKLTTRRRRRRVGVAAMGTVLVATIAVVGILNRPGQKLTEPAVKDRSSSSTITAMAGPWGFSVETTVSFSSSRQLLSGHFELGGRDYPVSFYPNDGTDNDVQPNPLPLAAGVTVSSSAKLQPDCASDPVPPNLLIRSRLDNGQVTTDRFNTANPGEFAAVFAQWCRKGAQATVVSGRGTPEGGARVTLQIINPTTRAITIASESYDAGATHWNSASVTVPAGATRSLVVAGTHVACTGQHSPWNDGHLLSDGRPLHLAQPENNLC